MRRKTSQISGVVAFSIATLVATTNGGSSWYQGDITGQIVGPAGVVTPGPSRASSNRAWVNDPG
jgi:hypothetical protein